LISIQIGSMDGLGRVVQYHTALIEERERIQKKFVVVIGSGLWLLDVRHC
jgi:hypothetical protein